MKRFLTMIVAVCAFFAASAQFPMVTLSHNGELTFFTNIDAFNSAYEAAEDGDTLYLSEGTFVLNESLCIIKKRISIVGTGYRSYILGEISFVLTEDKSSVMNEPLFDGVRLESLIFEITNNANKNLGETEIKRCWIKKIINADYAGTNITYDKCYIESMHCWNSTGHGNVVLTNSKVGNMNDCVYISAIHCNILEADYYPGHMISSILCQGDAPSIGPNTPTAINTLFLYTPDSETVILDNCYTYTMNLGLVDDKLNTLVDLVRYGYIGHDNTEVGIRGGEDPFTENPSVPTVDTAKSSVEYDSTDNKLKISITVKAD